MKRTGEWLFKSALLACLAVGAVIWGTGCGKDKDEEDDPTPVESLQISNRYALAVGIDNYAPGYASPLPSCVNDANGFAGELAKDGSLWKGSGKPLPASITVLTDADASLSAIRGKLQQFASVAQSGDLVVYFHSSHGGDGGTLDSSPDGTPDATYLCAYNTEYQDEALAEDLALFRDGVSVVVVIDACFSAGMYKGGPEFAFPQRVMSALAKVNKAKAVKGPSVGWMASSDYTELSDAGLIFSRFTQYLIAAFANGDADHSGALTFKELFDYAVPRTQPNHNPQSLNNSLLAGLVAAAVDPAAPGAGN